MVIDGSETESLFYFSIGPTFEPNTSNPDGAPPVLLLAKILGTIAAMGFALLAFDLAVAIGRAFVDVLCNRD